MELCSNEFKAYCKSKHNVRHYTIPYTTQHDGVAQCWNRTIIYNECCMLSNLGLNRRFYVEIASIICYLINHSHCITIGKKTSIEIWFGSLVDYAKLRGFSCTFYTHVVDGKLEPRAIKCIFFCYQLGVKCYKLWNSRTRKVVLSKNVIFNESSMLLDNLSIVAPIDGERKCVCETSSL